MRSSASSFVVVSLLALTIAACGSSGSDSPPGTEPGAGPNGTDGGPDAPAPSAPAVTGTPVNDELTDQLGVFVSPTGADNADGTRAHPLARIQPAIDLAHKVGKRVYVCTGVYREALVVADSNSIIGGLDCSGEVWKTGAAHSRVESPTVPAMLAKDIVTATRIEALDATGTSKCLLDVPRWDFHHQEAYWLDEGVRIGRAALTCRWDNRNGAQPLDNGRRRPAKELRWGEGTNDEMCLSFLYTTL